MSHLEEFKTKFKQLFLLMDDEEDNSDEDENEDPNFIKVLRFQSSEEELLTTLIQPQRNQRNSVKNYAEEVVPKYNEEEFRTHFRINTTIFKVLMARFEISEYFIHLRFDKRISASKHILVFLWFAGHEASSFRDIGDRFNICIATVSRVILRVTYFLSNLAEEVIVWPDQKRMEDTTNFFLSKNGFPKVIGALDGTHIVIDPPKEGKDDYINRKGQTSVVLQAICDENKKFIDIFVGYPGSAHDSRVFQNSFIFPKFKALCKDNFVLGDSAYPLSTNLLTPYKDNGHLSAAQKNFNIQLSSCRVFIEHSFGILKQRFRQLYYCKLRGMPKLCHFIRACCVLHNLAGESDLDFELTTEKEASHSEATDQHINSNTNLAKTVRDSICENLWRTKTNTQ